MKVDLSKAMEKILNEYGDEVKEIIDREIVDVGKETASYLKSKSPRSKMGGRHYANGWTSSAEQTWSGITLTIHNKTKPQLTHLLNDGHHFVTRSGERKRDIAGDHHIDDAEEYANNLLIQKVESKL